MSKGGAVLCAVAQCLHLCNAQGLPFAILQPALLSQICNLLPKLPQQGCPEPLGQYFLPDFSRLLFPWLCMLQCYGRFLLGRNRPPLPSFYLPLILWLLVYINTKISLGG